MKTYAKFAIFFAAGAFAIRLTAFYMNLNPADVVRYGVMMHILFILVAIFFGIKTAEQPSSNSERELLLTDFKAGLKSGGLYTVITTFLTYMYYKFIDAQYFVLKQQELIDAQVEAGKPVQEATESIQGFFSLQNYTAITLIGFITATGIFTVLLTVINRFVLNRLR